LDKYLRYLFILVFAFIAQMIDGGIGMGFGTSLTTLLLSIGTGTALASASVHLTEVFTTLVSGASHLKFGNVDRKLFTYLVVPGIIGGSLGAYAAVRFESVSVIRPFVSGILLLLGIWIIVKFVEKKDVLEREYETLHRKHLIPLGLVASFIDAIGGGGWGPISTPVLVANNTQPAKAIGSVNAAEFFVTLSISATFFLTLPAIDWRIIAPMIIGGVLAAPIAAWIARKLPHRALGIAVGTLIILLSLRTILKATGIGFPF